MDYVLIPVQGLGVLKLTTAAFTQALAAGQELIQPVPTPVPIPRAMSRPTTMLVRQTGFLKLKHIIGDQRKGVPGVLPVSTSTWYEWIKQGRAPRPIKVGRTSLWRAEDIHALIKKLSG